MDKSNKTEIEKKIATIDREFSSRWGRHYFKGAKSSDIITLEETLSTVKIVYKLSSILAKIFLLLLCGLVLLKVLDVDIFIDLNKLSVLIVFAFAFLINAYRTYKVMVNLEFKIFLMRMLNELD
ncbi:hypothetical protein [uncultured Acetobacteroides sp.]|uniref:hypothetical protein n=1 Tax=uncultured Acetobacteroides sp. TaxID=1760811 RepID=UPI0029F51B36|nr:hypothetical protein [uncultured Acetobacteroides sp.]